MNYEVAVEAVEEMVLRDRNVEAIREIIERYENEVSKRKEKE